MQEMIQEPDVGILQLQKEISEVSEKLPLPPLFEKQDKVASGEFKVQVLDSSEKPIKSALVVRMVPDKRLIVLKVGKKLPKFKYKSAWIIDGHVYGAIALNPKKKLVGLVYVFPLEEVREKILASV